MSFNKPPEGATYEIQDELRIRKVLEEHTDWTFEFTKNDKYGYDLQLFEWPDDADRPDDRELYGYIEIERAEKWVTGDPPDNWKFVSFLKRKIYDWDYTTRSWGGLKSNYRRTLYLKFNKSLDNCFVAPIETIHREGVLTPRSDGTRQGSFLSLNFEHPDVVFGIRDSTEFADEWLSMVEDEQTALDRFGDGH